MHIGHITKRSRRAALEVEGDEVLCLECLIPTTVKSIDCGFGDDFGGVSDWRSVTKCCEGEEFRYLGCDNCDAMVAVEKYGDNLLCEYCMAEAKGEEVVR